MDPLATIDAFTDRLGRDLADSERTRAQALLVDASAKIRSFTSQEISLDSSTDRVRVRSRDGRIPLAQAPVVSVATVISVPGGVNVPFYWDGLALWGGWSFPDSNVEGPIGWERRRHGMVVDVTYMHGLDPIPDEIVALTCQVAARALGVRPDESGVSQETISGYSYTLGSAAAAGGLGLLPAEEEVLKNYMAPNVRPIQILL